MAADRGAFSGKHSSYITAATPYRLSPMSIAPAVLNERETAIYLHVSVGLLRKWRRQGRGPKFVKLEGKLVRYLIKDLNEWLKSYCCLRKIRVEHDESCRSRFI
jgi:predicted DNA-binding transcriptional regulator AlpA